MLLTEKPVQFSQRLPHYNSKMRVPAQVVETLFKLTKSEPQKIEHYVSTNQISLENIKKTLISQPDLGKKILSFLRHRCWFFPKAIDSAGLGACLYNISTNRKHKCQIEAKKTIQQWKQYSTENTRRVRFEREGKTWPIFYYGKDGTLEDFRDQLNRTRMNKFRRKMKWNDSVEWSSVRKRKRAVCSPAAEAEAERCARTNEAFRGEAKERYEKFSSGKRKRAKPTFEIPNQGTKTRQPEPNEPKSTAPKSNENTKKRRKLNKLNDIEKNEITILFKCLSNAGFVREHQAKLEIPAQKERPLPHPISSTPEPQYQQTYSHEYSQNQDFLRDSHVLRQVIWFCFFSVQIIIQIQQQVLLLGLTSDYHVIL